MRFCNRNGGCDNILTSEIKNNKLIFKCNICNETYDSSPEDTLLIDEYIRESDTLYKYQTYLRNAHNDDIAELKKKQCTSCNEPIVKVVKVDKNGQIIYICPKCKHQFI
jgi:DNA-directed RNA polymerase subunit M/transcription elongation factor TFIIS